MARQRLPRHVGFIPDGNRRWAVGQGLTKDEGYARGIDPGVVLMDQCLSAGIEEVSVYCFTQDNTKRAREQKEAFTDATLAFAEIARSRDVALLAVGDAASDQFPDALRPFTTRQGDGMKVNLLVNYGWRWDLDGLKNGGLRSADVGRIDLIVRWGGMFRLSGFLPVQSVYADVYIRYELWPDFQPSHFEDALDWFQRQDRTLGG